MRSPANPGNLVNRAIPLQVSVVPFATDLPKPLKENEIFVPISKEEYEEISKPWETSVICKIMGKSFSYEFLQQELGMLWNWVGKMETIALGKGFFSIKCGSSERR